MRMTILDEDLNEVKGTRKAVKQFTSTIKNITEVADFVNKIMDKFLKNVNKLMIEWKRINIINNIISLYQSIK